MKTAVIVFPGSNCDRDLALALEAVTGQPCQRVWHQETTLPNVDFVGLPGGFSYGDYLRCGALAAVSPIIKDLKKTLKAGLPMIGICNGFQILCETGILPGMLMPNAGGRFIHRDERLQVASGTGPFFQGIALGPRWIFHRASRWVVSNRFTNIGQLKGDGRIALTYADNPNGSVQDIAGILSTNHRILGLMPHPERHMEGMANAFLRRPWAP